MPDVQAASATASASASAPERVAGSPPAPAPTATTERELVLGMFAFRPTELLQQRWQPLAIYLSEQLPGHQVSLRLLDLEALKQALSRDELDLLFTNPVHYIQLRQQFPMSGALATLMRREQDQVVSQLGGVIITRAERDDLNSLTDLVHQDILAVGQEFLGGYIAPLETLNAAGVRAHQLRMQFDPATHDAVVFGVINGRADAGFVRTGILEQLQAEGRIELASLKILGAKTDPTFPFLLSTQRFPEWPIMALPGLDPSVGRQFAAALIQLDPEHPAAQAAGIAGFDLPADYGMLESVMRELRVAPFDHQRAPSWREIWIAYQHELLLVAGLVLLATGLLISLVINNQQQRRIRSQITASEQRWFSALDGAGHGVWDWNARANSAYYSKRWKTMLGYRDEEITPDFEEWSQRIHPEDRAPTLDALERYRSGHSDEFSVTHRLSTKQGAYLWILARGVAVERDRNGEALRIIGTNTDFTRYRTAEIALAEKEQLFLALVNQAPDGMALLDPDTRQFVEFNSATYSRLGYTAAEFAGLGLDEVEALQSVEQQITQIEEIKRNGSAVFYSQHRQKDGRLRDMRISTRMVVQNGKPFIATVMTDLTDLRQAERARLLSQQDFQATFEQAAVGMAHVALDGRFLRVNRQLAEMLGYSSEQLRQRHFQALTHADDLENNLQLFERVKSGEIECYRLEKRYYRQDGGIVWALVTMSLVRAEDGSPAYFVGVIEDISARKQAEEQLHVAAQMVDLAAYAIIATDMNGLISQFNPAAERLLGYTAEEIIGRQTPLRFHLNSEIQARAEELSTQFSEEIEPGFRVFTEPLLRDGEETREWTLQRADGERLSVLLSTTLLRRSDGRPRGVLGNLADISPLRQATEALRRERDRAQRYLDTAGSLIISIDTQGRVELANRYTCELLGRSEQAVVGQDWFDLCIAAADRPALRDFFMQLLNGTRKAEDYLENRLISADGSQHLIAWRSSLLYDEAGQVSGVLAAGNDITERDKLESARAQALAEAKRLAAVKSAFIANMSHEIRTPLNGILGLAQIGRRDHDTEPAAQLFRQIKTAGQHLLILINDILDFSKLDAGKLSIQRQPFCIRDCLAEIESLLSPQTTAKGLRLGIAIADGLPAWVFGDAMRLRQILLNLLGNAIKFTESGEVRLMLSTADAADWADRADAAGAGAGAGAGVGVGAEPSAFTEATGILRFQVTDTGIGMNAEQITRIFQPFEQADAGTTRSHGGTGLGLTISLALTKMMGGRLSVDSEPNIGSCFELRLPLPPAAAPQRSLPDDVSSETQRLAGLHILAVDDVELNLLVLDKLLSFEGARISMAHDGQAALRQLEAADSDPFDLVLMDVQMPVMDGYEATRRIRTRWPSLPVIGLTAHAMPEDRDRCLNAGMVAHLTKPIDLEALLAALHQLRQVRPLGLARTGSANTDAVVDADADADANTESGAATGASTGARDGTHASADACAEQAQQPAFDWARLQQGFVESPGFVQRLIDTALSSQRDTPARLRHRAAQGDLDECFRIAHMLKSFAAHLSAEPLRQHAEVVCEQARSGDRAALEGAEALARSLEQLLHALAAHARENWSAPDVERRDAC
ncbi:MAG: PAS domain S-box protein [Lamprobacter sp.]|uniref:PAS domain S-box protein n=1 Tax=Lamprobacter sp. TaxID=3100796 RepID=UPI002B25C61E|nr:PAS domain S-box protein [Lamprobacter sp.]MEA3639452.1 PAS domain S-box protein [Lamprobacter sp.]